MTTVVGVLGRGIVAADEAVVRADDLGLTRGDGCFESCRVLTAPDGSSVVERLDAHLARLSGSLAAMEIVADLAACRALIELVAGHWTEPGEAVVKLMVTRGVEGAGVEGACVEGAGVEGAGVKGAGVKGAGGDDVATPTVVATLKPVGAGALRQRREGTRVVSLQRGTESDTYTDAPWLLGGVKSLSYALNMAAVREAVRRGADDALWIARDGTVLEAPTATVVWTRDRRLSTTPVGGTGILAGTTMAALFDGARVDGFDVRIEPASLAELVAADGIWLVSAVRGVAEVIELDGVARARRTALTARLNRYADF